MNFASPTPVLGQLSLNIRDADIRAFIQDAARVTGRTIIIDSRVQGKVSVVTDRLLTRSEYFEIFLSTLRANGLIAVPVTGGALRVQPIEGAARQPGRIGAPASHNQFVTEVIRLKSIDATAALEALSPLISTGGSITPNRSGRSIVVVDYGDNVLRIRELVAQIDRDDSATTLITLSNASARDVALSLQTLMNGANNSQPAVAIVAIDSSNTLALRGNASSLSRLSVLVRDLDKRASAGTEIKVYWLQYADADKIVPVLTQLLGQGAAGPSQTTPPDGHPSPRPTQSVASAAASTALASAMNAGTDAGVADRGPALVARYEGANAVIIAASTNTQRALGYVIRQLDTRREQVLVEAIIVEIGDNAARNLGVQLLMGSTTRGFAATNYSNAQPNIVTLAGAIGTTAASQKTTTVVAPDGTRTTTTTTENSALANDLQKAAVTAIQTAPGSFAGFTAPFGKNGVFGAIINAVQSDTQSNILSTPSITTLDNQKAHMLVGQEVPIATGEALSTNLDNRFRTVQRQNVGIILDVTPQISSGGTVKLFIKQEVSSVAGPVSSSSADLIINKREFETTVLVDDGDILAIGGLLDDNERRTIERIPLLSSIPVVGALFTSKSRARSKTNLMVFIRPTILSNRAEAQNMTARRYGYVRQQQEAANPDVEPSIDELVNDYLGAERPVSPSSTTDKGSVLLGRKNVPKSSLSTPLEPRAPTAHPRNLPKSLGGND